MPLEHTNDEVFKEAIKKSGIKASHIKSKMILRRSVDARRNTVRFNYSVFFDTTESVKLNDFTHEFEPYKDDFVFEGRLPCRPVIVGMGPAGLFAGYYLAKFGCAPIIFERGGSMDNRVNSHKSFIHKRILDTECNAQFGEGGAGTFSDGKLTTRINDNLCNEVLNTFVRHGATEDILYLAKPHVGTDIIRNVIVSMRDYIISRGGEVHFDSRLDAVNISNGALKSITVNGNEHECKVLLLAIGHSARDTYEMLYKSGVSMAPKPFAMGLRIEHRQAYIDAAQYGKYAGHPALGPADYRLAYNGVNRKCFSFCMCPGGSVVAAASEENMVVVNGMSNYARDGKNANSALVVNVTENDFDGVLGGIELQRKCERAAYRMGGGGYMAPVQLTSDFLEGKSTTKLKNVKPSYPLGYEFADMDGCVPEFVAKTLREGIRYFDRKIKGFSDNSVLTGVETRTSAPVRILRNGNMESINVKGLYPIGEGAGYAGGIMSSAVDGIKAAQRLLCGEMCN
ncbi:MAG: hypothetical protein BWY15_00139 [Firmicutes bacterium ADurb.Bin193]|nr:MAG: hypothetical protein BWY15_00139 [Firmicutes bacterium ADurb.Bin193]